MAPLPDAWSAYAPDTIVTAIALVNEPTSPLYQQVNIKIDAIRLAGLRDALNHITGPLNRR